MFCNVFRQRRSTLPERIPFTRVTARDQVRVQYNLSYAIDTTYNRRTRNDTAPVVLASKNYVFFLFYV